MSISFPRLEGCPVASAIDASQEIVGNVVFLHLLVGFFATSYYLCSPLLRGALVGDLVSRPLPLPGEMIAA